MHKKVIVTNNHFIEYLESGEIRYPQICRDRKSVWLSQEQTLRFKSTNRDDFVIKRLTTGDFSYAFTVVITTSGNNEGSQRGRPKIYYRAESTNTGNPRISLSNNITCTSGQRFQWQKVVKNR